LGTDSIIYIELTLGKNASFPLGSPFSRDTSHKTLDSIFSIVLTFTKRASFLPTLSVEVLKLVSRGKKENESQERTPLFPWDGSLGDRLHDLHILNIRKERLFFLGGSIFPTLSVEILKLVSRGKKENESQKVVTTTLSEAQFMSFRDIHM